MRELGYAERKTQVVKSLTGRPGTFQSWVSRAQNRENRIPYKKNF